MTATLPPGVTLYEGECAHQLARPLALSERFSAYCRECGAVLLPPDS